MHGNAKVDQAQTEVEWQLLQTDPGNPAAGQLESGYGAPVGANAAAVIRRYEFYSFAGRYDPETHEALFDKGFGDSKPGPTDLGSYLGAQNGAVNLDVAAAVPEPQTWALMLGGLLLMGRRLRRQHRA